MNLHDGYMVIHCTTLSSFLYILKFFIIVKKKRDRTFFPQVIPLSLAIQQSHHHNRGLLFYKKDTATGYPDSQFPQRHCKSLATENVYGILDTYSSNIPTRASTCL